MEISFTRYEDEDAHICVSLPLTSHQKRVRTWRTAWQKSAWIFSLPKVFSF